MKMPRPRFLVVGLLLCTSLQAGSLESAFQARAIIGDGIWSRVLRIENERPGRGSRYPAEFHALVMAVEGILWLYTETEGTQSISRYADQLEEDQNDLGPLLQAVESGLVRFEDVTDRPPLDLPDRAPLHACFPAAVARWDELRRESNPPTRARLPAFYPSRDRRGHMVWEYWRDGQRYLFDVSRPGEDLRLPARLADDPLEAARMLFEQGHPSWPVRARYLDLGRA